MSCVDYGVLLATGLLVHVVACDGNSGALPSEDPLPPVASGAPVVSHASSTPAASAAPAASAFASTPDALNDEVSNENGPDEPALLHGSCAAGLPMGPLANYQHVVELFGASRVNVRADPSFAGDEHANVLGKLDAPQKVSAFGPVKAIPSHGIGWVVPLVDEQGKTCRGYLSATVARAVACNLRHEKLVPFPKPLDVHPGPCLVR